MIWSDYLPAGLTELYEIHDYGHAAAILKHEFPEEFGDVVGALSKFRLKNPI